jgi:tripartite-type tricarboxylate transporter receptor subunit TctC
VIGGKRSPLAPEVPTLDESGIRGFNDFVTWSGLLAPAGTPRDIIATLNKAFVRALADADVKNRLAGSGAEALGSTPGELSDRLRRELPMWAEVVRAAGAKVD